jgi:hypothetical protein
MFYLGLFLRPKVMNECFVPCTQRRSGVPIPLILHGLMPAGGERGHESLRTPVKIDPEPTSHAT